MLNALPQGKKLAQKHREMLNLSRDFANGGGRASLRHQMVPGSQVGGHVHDQ